MEKLKQLLQQVSKIVAEEKVLQDERRKRGELFNIFKVLHLSTDEVRLHSAFIAELLNPKGDHGLGEKFLQAFIDDVISDDEFSFDSQSAEVDPEHYIGLITSDGTEGGKIDIFLEDKYGHTIIIENKIYAVDQNNQLLRYYNFAIQNTKGRKHNDEGANKLFCLLYLTLDGKEASSTSLGQTEFEYECITYRKDILNWLNHCVGIAALHPSVRETISQYIINLKNILSIMNDNNKQELMKIMAANPDATAAIINNGGNYIQYVYTTFVKPKLEEFARENNLIYKENNLFTGKNGGRGFCFHKEEWKKSAIWVWTDRKEECEFYIGVSNYLGEALKVTKEKLDCLEKEPTDGFPYGWNTLEPEYGNWWAEYMPNMINGKFTTYIKEFVSKILKELEDKDMP